MVKNSWRTAAVSLLLILSLLATVAATGKERVGWLVADQVTVLEGGMTLNSAMVLQDSLTVGTDGTSYDVTFYSDTAGDYFLWDQSEEALTIIGTNGQDALNVDDGNVDIDDNVDVNGTTNLDEVDIDGAVQVDAAVTLGTDGTSFDVVWYSDTAGDYLRWDQSAEALVITGTNGATALNILDGNAAVVDDLDVGGTANLDAVDIDDAVQIDGATTFGVDGTAFDVVWYSDTTGDYMRYDQSAEALVITGTNAATALSVPDGNVDIEDQLNVNGAVDLDSTLAVAGKVTAEGDLEVDDWLVLDVGAATISIGVTESITTATGTYMLVSCSAGGGCTPATPAISNGTEVGQILILQITGSNNITLTDDLNLQLGGATRVMDAAKGDIITLMWNGTDWFEISWTDVN